MSKKRDLSPFCLVTSKSLVPCVHQCKRFLLSFYFRISQLRTPNQIYFETRHSNKGGRQFRDSGLAELFGLRVTFLQPIENHPMDHLDSVLVFAFIFAINILPLLFLEFTNLIIKLCDFLISINEFKEPPLSLIFIAHY